MPTDTSCAACTVCCTLRAISAVAAPCCSTAAAMLPTIALTFSIVAAIPRIASTASLVAVWICAIWPADLFRGLSGLVGQAFHFRGHNGEALTSIAGTSRLNRGVQCQQIRLAGNIRNEADHCTYSVGTFGKRMNNRIGALGIFNRRHGHRG